jgi:hypothetical protein
MVLVLSACAASDGPTPPSAEIPQPTASQPTQTARVSAPTTIEREIKAPKPADIMGSPSSKLVSALGSATLVRTDIGVEIWQYRTDECVLFVFLYPGEREMAVRHIDSRGGPTPESCIRSVVKTKLSRKLG